MSSHTRTSRLHYSVKLDCLLTKPIDRARIQRGYGRRRGSVRPRRRPTAQRGTSSVWLSVWTAFWLLANVFDCDVGTICHYHCRVSGMGVTVPNQGWPYRG